MLTDFRAETDLQAGRINIYWGWLDPGARPGLRLLRQAHAWPRTVDEGTTVLDLADLFQTPETPWAASEHTLYVVSNSSANGEMWKAEALFFFANEVDIQPQQARLRIYDTATDRMQTLVFDNLSRVERTESNPPEWAERVTLQFFALADGGGELFHGALVISTGHNDGVTADQLAWVATDGSTLRIVFDRVDAQITTAIAPTSTIGAVQVNFATRRAGADLRLPTMPATFQVQNPDPDLVVQTTLDEFFDRDTGDWQRTVALTEMALTPEIVYYYALFVPDGADPSGFHSEQAWRTAARATADYGTSDRLYGLLPAVHQQYDEPLPTSTGGAADSTGQLQRFLQIFGTGLDQVRSGQEGLRQLHDVAETHADLLPHLAHWIGWELDQTLDVDTQRSDIRFAPEVFSSTGTVPNIRALVNRMTGWECEVKEFVHNLFLTNAVETIQLWEIWSRTHDGVDWSEPTPVTQTDGLDGRPVVTLADDNTPWLFWHANRGADRDRREIWLQRLDLLNAAPQPATLDAPDDVPGVRYTDESPTAVTRASEIWLFWQSNRDGVWEIYGRTYTGLPGGEAMRLTEHPAADRHPAVARGSDESIWLFWQADRRGPTDIWGQTYDGDSWSLPARLTNATLRDEMPAAAVDAADQLWLFWSADLGDRRNLFVRVRTSSSAAGILLEGWSTPAPLTEGAWRDEAPSAHLFNGRLWLFWHSNRGGTWQIWTMQHNGIEWSDPVAVTAELTGDKEPTVVVDSSGDLRLFWRSQRRGRHYQSRTVDTSDPQMLSQLRTFDDRAHYTYDTGLDNEDWYARGAVGLYVMPDTTDETEIADQINRAHTAVESFRPTPVRFVWVTEEAGA